MEGAKTDGGGDCGCRRGAWEENEVTGDAKVDSVNKAWERRALVAGMALEEVAVVVVVVVNVVLRTISVAFV